MSETQSENHEFDDPMADFRQPINDLYLSLQHALEKLAEDIDSQIPEDLQLPESMVFANIICGQSTLLQALLDVMPLLLLSRTLGKKVTTEAVYQKLRDGLATQVNICAETFSEMARQQKMTDRQKPKPPRIPIR